LNTPVHVFVYGTLKPGQRWFGQYCAPYVIARRQAIAPGRLYHLPLGYPAMTLEPGWVRGVLLTFETTAVLAALDQLEDYYPDRPEASEYQRIRHPVYSPQQIDLGIAWVYVMAPARVKTLGGQWVPGGDWRGDHPSG